jgi:glycosyltransferase involved in cell wall biosynthesis
VNHRRQILIAIPAYNEEDSIINTIETCKSDFPSAELLIVNDCSTDKTLELIRQSGVNFLSLPFNLGVGGAMRAAFQFALINNFSFLIQVDADGQHNPRDVEKLIAKSSSFDIVIGSRFLISEGYKVDRIRKFAITITSKYLYLITKKRISDPTSGFRLSNRKAIELFSHSYPIEYLEDTVGSIVLANINGLSIGECASPMNERQGGKPSQNPLKSVAHLSRTLIAITMMKLGNKKIVREGK